MQQKDVHLIAEFVEVLRCFGCDDHDPLILQGMKVLLQLQTVGGIWDYTVDDPYRTYHATMCGAQALLAHKFRGYGPGISSVTPLLLEWIDNDLKNVSVITTTTAVNYVNNTIVDVIKPSIMERQEKNMLKNQEIRKIRQQEFKNYMNFDSIEKGISGNSNKRGYQDINHPSDLAAHSEERYLSF